MAPDSPLAHLGMRATLKVFPCELHQDEYYDYDHDNFKDLTHDPAVYQFPFSPPPKSPSSGPRSIYKKPQTSDYWDNGILTDESPSTNVLQPIGANRKQNVASKEEQVEKLSRQQRDTTGQTIPRGKKVVDVPQPYHSEANDKDFYDDDEYNSTDFEYVDLYEELDPRSHGGQLHTYFIAAEEVMWDYGGGRSPYFTKDR